MRALRASSVRFASLVFDVRLQPRQRVVPLLRYLIEIVPNLLDRPRFELKQTFAPDAYTAHHSRLRQDAEVLCYRLPRQIGARGQTRDGLPLTTRELGK